jgi:hypothetical protein
VGIYKPMMEVYGSRKDKVMGGIRDLCVGFDEEVKVDDRLLESHYKTHLSDWITFLRTPRTFIEGI